MRGPSFFISSSTIVPRTPCRFCRCRDRIPNTNEPAGSRPMKPTMPKAMPTAQLINELQSCGVRLVDPKAGHESRRGGAGPSDHKAMTIDGMTVMVPVHTAPAFASPYFVEKPDASGHSDVRRDGVILGDVSFPMRPRFYNRSTADGIAYWKIAVLHGRDVLA